MPVPGLVISHTHTPADEARSITPTPRSLCKKMNPMNSAVFVLFDKYCPIVDQLGLKDSSRDFQLNCVISFFLPTFNTPCKRLKIDVMERESEKTWNLDGI